MVGQAVSGDVRADNFSVPREQGHSHPKYRPDIDGLRGVAVISAFVFHLAPYKFPSGAIGVELFFVISGYLIGGILLRDAAAGTLSLREFYERRFRRISPAFLAMVAGVCLIAPFLLLPPELETLGLSGLTALFSGSNFYFWQTVNYFNQAAESQIYLHTWTLGNEEQFYLFAPLFILAIFRWAPRHVRTCVFVAMALSFLISVMRVKTDTPGAFYLPDSRAWELLLGVSLHLIPLDWMKDGWRREAASITGVLMLALGYALIRPATNFPGFAAVLPCVGAALLMAADERGQTVVGRVLAAPPLRFIGLISYSLYLWHWPSIIFTREFLFWMGWPQKWMSPVAIVLALIVAIPSWRYIERYFRVGKPLPRIAPFVIYGTLALAAVHLLFWVSKGLPQRYEPRTVALARFDQPVDPWGKACMDRNWASGAADVRVCLTPQAGKPNILLVGDSHAVMFRSALRDLTGANILSVTAVGCPPELLAGPGGPDCIVAMRGALERHIVWRGVDHIVLSGRLANADPARLAATIAWLKRHAPVTVIGPMPEYRTSVPILLAMAHQRGNDALVQAAARADVPRNDALAERVARAQGVGYVSPMRLMCDGRRCETSLSGVPLYVDRDHLTVAGATRMVRAADAKGLLADLPRTSAGL